MHNFVFRVLSNYCKSSFLSGCLSVLCDALVDTGVNGFFDQEFTADVILWRSDLCNMLFVGFRLLNNILFILATSFTFEGSYVGNVRYDR